MNKSCKLCQGKINKLKSENAQLRLLFRVILDTAYLAVNGQETETDQVPEEEKNEEEVSHE